MKAGAIRQGWEISLTVLLAIGLFGPAARAATAIYRSVGSGNTSVLATGGGNPLASSGNTATFFQPLPDRVGVGDVIQYDSDNDGTIDSLAFIHGRADSTHCTVKNKDGNTS